MEDRWALDDIAVLVGFPRDAHPAEVVRAVRAELARVLPVVGAAREVAESWDRGEWRTGPRGTEVMQKLASTVETADILADPDTVAAIAEGEATITDEMRWTPADGDAAAVPSCRGRDCGRDGCSSCDGIRAWLARLDGDAAATPQPAARAESGDPDPGALIGRTDDWWIGYSAGCEASHAIGCSAVEAERDHLREQLERCEVMGEQRIADLQAEFARQDKIRDRQLDAARASLAAVSSAPPVDIHARIRAAAHAAFTAMDKGVLMSETGDGAESVLAVGHLHLIAEYLDRHPDWPSAQAIVRALATPTTDTPGGDR
jgi:hypothetical protein